VPIEFSRSDPAFAISSASRKTYGIFDPEGTLGVSPLDRQTADPRGKLAIRESHPGASGASSRSWRNANGSMSRKKRNATFAVMATLRR